MLETLDQLQHFLKRICKPHVAHMMLPRYLYSSSRNEAKQESKTALATERNHLESYFDLDSELPCIVYCFVASTPC